MARERGWRRRALRRPSRSGRYDDVRGWSAHRAIACAALRSKASALYRDRLYPQLVFSRPFHFPLPVPNPHPCQSTYL